VRVVQALSDYVAASQALALLIGDPAVVGGSAIYLPIGYADDLATQLPVSLDTALTAAEENRPDFKIEDLNRTIREINMGLAKNLARPDLQVSAGVGATQAGTTYGYEDALKSHTAVIDPDDLNQTYGAIYKFPWNNRAARAGVETAKLRLHDQNLSIEALQNRVRREITERLAAVQASRARVRSGTAEVNSLRSAYSSLERQHSIAGNVSEDELITAARKLLIAQVSLTGAMIDAKQAESGLLFAQGTIAGALAAQSATSEMDRGRITLLSDSGYLKFFNPAVKVSKP
jgi:outer membrane protein TolC